MKTDLNTTRFRSGDRAILCAEVDVLTACDTPFGTAVVVSVPRPLYEDDLAPLDNVHKLETARDRASEILVATDPRRRASEVPAATQDAEPIPEVPHG